MKHYTTERLREEFLIEKCLHREDSVGIQSYRQNHYGIGYTDGRA